MDDHLYGDKEVFVTAAYREKVAADAARRAGEADAEAAEAADSARAKGHMGDFYKNLLTDNVAMGTGVAAAASAVAAPVAISSNW